MKALFNAAFGIVGVTVDLFSKQKKAHAFLQQVKTEIQTDPVQAADNTRHGITLECGRVLKEALKFTLATTPIEHLAPTTQQKIDQFSDYVAQQYLGILKAPIDPQAATTLSTIRDFVVESVRHPIQSRIDLTVGVTKRAGHYIKEGLKLLVNMRNPNDRISREIVETLDNFRISNCKSSKKTRFTITFPHRDTIYKPYLYPNFLYHKQNMSNYQELESQQLKIKLIQQIFSFKLPLYF